MASFEVKLSTIRLWMDRKKKEMLETYDNRLQFDRLLTDSGQELLQQPFGGKAGMRMPSQNRCGCQLHFCFPKAYSELRRFFRLPSVSAIRSCVDCPSRITALSIQKVTELVQKSDQFKDWVLLVDVMHIRNEIWWSAHRKKMVGFVNTGGGNAEDEDDLQQLARESVVILAVAMQSSRKLPVDYILPDSTTSDQL